MTNISHFKDKYFTCVSKSSVAIDKKNWPIVAVGVTKLHCVASQSLLANVNLVTFTKVVKHDYNVRGGLCIY